MLNHVKSVVYGFSLFPQLLVLYSSASWLQWPLFSGHIFFGVGSSENCLNQFSGKREVRAAGSISNLILGFWVLSAKFQSLIFKTMSRFGFLRFGFCLWIKAELILFPEKRNPLKLKHNKAFKWDSCRVAFWVCSEFCGEGGLRKVGLGGTHPLTQR